jgi:predicted phage baseplate assembly protein
MFRRPQACSSPGRGGWLRELITPLLGQRPQRVADGAGVGAFTIGGTVPTVHAEVIRSEVIGRSDGTPGQHFELQRRPVVTSDSPARLTALVDNQEQSWQQVSHFALSGPNDRHFRIDEYAGEVQFGPSVRSPNSTLVAYGAVPAAGAVLRLESYRTGGGQ